MTLNKAALIILLTLVLSTAFMVLIPTLALADETEKQKAETLLRILDSNNVSILTAFSNLEAQNIAVPPAAEAKYNEGLVHATEAANLMSVDNFSEASVEAVEAMQLFKEALLLLENTSQTEPTETQVAAENITRLKASLTQAFRYVERLENMSAKARTAGYNTSVFDAKISEARNHLETASDKLDKLNSEDALNELQVAKALRSELKTLLDRLTQAVKAANAESYLQEAEDRLNATRDDILNSVDLSPDVREVAIDALDTSGEFLDDARDSLTSNLDEAIADLEEAKKWEDEANNVIASATGVNSFEPTNDSLTSAR